MSQSPSSEVVKNTKYTKASIQKVGKCVLTIHEEARVCDNYPPQ